MGTIINIITVLLGGVIGLLLGSRFPNRMRETVVSALGLFSTAVGLQMTFSSKNILIVLGAILIGGIIGELVGIDEGLKKVGEWLEEKTGNKGKEGTQGNFVRGFVMASLLFCVGPMTILGSIQDGLSGDYKLLAIKSVMDGFAALAFTSSLGVGVMFSTLTIAVYQGGLTLLAGYAKAILSDAMIAEMTATGGIMIMGIGVGSLLELKPIRVGNFLPALIIAPMIVGVLNLFGVV
jgi:uncharacterized membrane protein YqgA involved in biofilm formation